MRFKIGEIAKILGVSTNTLRRYENMGYLNAVRDEVSGYRYYEEEDVIALTDVRIMRKYGFTHDLIDKRKNYNIDESIELFRDRLDEIDRELEYMKSIRHRIKDDVLLMEKAKDLDAFYEKDCVEQLLVLYKSGGNLYTEPERLDTIQKFMYNSPEVQRIYLIRKDDIGKEDCRLSAGWAVKTKHMEQCGIVENEYTERYVTKPSVMSVVRLPLDDKGNDIENIRKELFLEKNLSYIKEHGFEIDGDAIGIVITKAYEEEQEYLYVLVSIPVKRG